MSYASILLGEIHASGKWYSVKDEKLNVTTDSEKVKEKIAERKSNSAVQNNDDSSSGSLTQEHKNALSQAKIYYYEMYMSKQKIYDQLIYNGFTASEAQYAINHLD